MPLEQIRKELDKFDNLIKNVVVLRMALIPIVADIKIKNNLELLQKGREDEIYRRIETFSKDNGIELNILTDIYKSLMQNAVLIEEKFRNQKEIIQPIDEECYRILKDKFDKLDNIVHAQISNIFTELYVIAQKKNLTLFEIVTSYYKKELD